MKGTESWLAAAAGVVTLLVAWFAGPFFKLSGADLFVMRTGVCALGAIGVGALLWPRIRANRATTGIKDKPAQSQADTPSHLLVNEAEKSCGRKLSDVPVVLVLNPDRSSPESLVEHSGIEPEQLAAVKGGRAWIADETIFLEVKPEIYEDAKLWASLIGSLKGQVMSLGLKRGPQAPRGIVVSVATSAFTRRENTDDVNKLAETLRARIRDISRGLAMPVPMYVVFHGLQCIPQFEHYAAHSDPDFLADPFGVTISVAQEYAKGVWSDRQNSQIANGLRQLFESISFRRLEVLTAEPMEERRQRAYLFPREFMKLTVLGPITSFLLELSRPPQIGAAPYLRGYYFTGVHEPRGIPRSRDIDDKPLRPPAQDFSLTQVMQDSPPLLEQEKPKAVAKGVEWAFAKRLFVDVILPDLRNLRGTFIGADILLWRRAALGSIVGLILLFGLLLALSFLGNRQMQSTAAAYPRTIPAPAAGIQQIPIEQLRELDSLRSFVEELGKPNIPWRLNFGLYTGAKLYPALRKLYFDRFNSYLLSPVQRSLGNYLIALPAANVPPGFDPAYEALKAYLITRSHPRKSTQEFLPQALLKWWISLGNDDRERRELGRKQFEFYSGQLLAEPPYPLLPDDKAIETSRNYIQEHFGGADRIYSSMLSEAGRNSPAVNFGGLYPNGENIVLNTPEVPGAFTRPGWLAMKSIMKDPKRWPQPEDWVVTMPQIGVTKGAAELSVRYQTEYSRRWNEFLEKTRVVTCRARTTPADVAKRLTPLSSPQSPLLGLFCLASANTDVDSADVRNAFQPLRAVVSQDCTRQLAADSNAEYTRALFALGQKMQDPSLAAPGTDARAVVAPQVMAGREAAHNLETKFQLDQQWQVSKSVARLLEEPVSGADSCAPGVQTSGVCSELKGLKSKYPFDPKSTSDASLQDFDRFFNPKTGTLWLYQQQALATLVTERNGQFVQNPAAARPVRPEFLAFLNRAARIRDTFYKAGAANPQWTFSVRIQPALGIASVLLRVGGTSHTYAAGQPESKQFTWSPTEGGAEIQAQASGGLSIPGRRFNGSWALFHLIDEMRVGTVSEGQTSLEWIIRENVSKQVMTTIKMDLIGDIGRVLGAELRSKLDCVQNVTQ